MPKTTFICKPVCLAELLSRSDAVRSRCVLDRDEYSIAAERRLSATDWKEFTADFLADRSWLEAFSNRKHPRAGEKVECIRVTSPCSRIALIVDTQGYSYARYIGIEFPA